MDPEEHGDLRIMANEDRETPRHRPTPDAHVIQMEDVGPVDWQKVMAELEQAAEEEIAAAEKQISREHQNARRARQAESAPQDDVEKTEEDVAARRAADRQAEVLEEEELDDDPISSALLDDDLEDEEEDSPIDISVDDDDFPSAELLVDSEPEANRYDEIRNRKSMGIPQEDRATFDDFAEILCSVNTALNQLRRFEKEHPYLMAPNIYRFWEENLQETATIMFRELHSLRNGKQNKEYDKRNVCSECHHVFMYPLPEGLCDECRSKKATRGSAPY